MEGHTALIDRILAGAPDRRVLDLGCGNVSLIRELGHRGFEVVAVAAIQEVLAEANRESVPESVEFLLGDFGAVERLVRGHFAAALCLGNTLPYLLSPESLSRMFIGLKRRLLPGSPIVLQLLNYDRIRAGGAQTLPGEVVAAPEGPRVLVRVVDPRDDGFVVHTTATLAYRTDREPRMEVLATQARQMRGWLRSELETVLDVARFSEVDVYGDLTGAPHDPETSLDLVLVAT